jgi:hypothetical protein
LALYSIEIASFLAMTRFHFLFSPLSAAGEERVTERSDGRVSQLID